MKHFIISGIMALTVFQLSAQKQVQGLNPAKIAIFKNGTFFVKKEAKVQVQDKSFYIVAPENVLMGTYWVSVSNDAQLQSIMVKADTFKIPKKAACIREYLQANIDQQVTLQGNTANSDIRKISGRLIEYNIQTNTIRMLLPNGNVIIASLQDYPWLEMSGKTNLSYIADSVISVAKIALAKDISSAAASTISLKNGIQWVPSYLFTAVTDKEAKLEMKATIVNNDETYRNMPVDIIIGNPEMFFGQQLDPVCVKYMNESLLNYRNDNYSYSLSNSLLNTNLGNGVVQARGNIYDNETYGGGNGDQKNGQKLEDLYYYQLGVMDLEKGSRTIVPVMSTTVNYSEIFTADLPVNSINMTGINSIQAYRNYRITNNGEAPFTTGSVFVLSKEQQPISQSRLTYTPVKGVTEMQLAKAVDVQVKNEETEITKMSSNVRKNSYDYYSKVQVGGSVTITNYNAKKIRIRVTKLVQGNYIKSSNGGAAKKMNNTDDEDEIISELSWEVDVEAGAKLKLSYEYYALK